MSTTFYDFNSLHDAEFRAQVLDVYKKIIDQNAFIDGEYNKLFESEFAKMQKAKHCLLLANGTDALEIALKVARVESNDYVAVPAISFYATAEAVINVGAKVVFVDVDPRTGLICLESFKRVIEQYPVKAVMPVHIYGLPAPIEELEPICKKNKIAIIEDAAQGQGGFLKNGPIGSSGHMTTFSFYPTKNLSAYGDAGAILTNDDAQAEEILSHRNHGRSPNGHALIGRNSRCDHLQAAVLYLKLARIDGWNETRKKVATWYMQALEGTPVQLLPRDTIQKSSWHLFPISVKNAAERLALNTYLNQNSVGTGLYYPKAMSQEIPLLNCPGETTIANKFAETRLCLPMHPFVTEQDVLTISNHIKKFFVGQR